MSPRSTGWYALLVATVSHGIANSVIFALLSDLQDKFGFGDAGLGMVAGSGFLVGLVGLILMSPFADRGHSKLLLLAGLATAAIGSVSFALSSSLWMLVLSRCIVGISSSMFVPAARAIAISLEEGNVARRLGLLSGIELAGFVTGPLIGGILAGPFGLRVPFLACGAFALVGFALLAPLDLPQPPITGRHRLAFDLLAIPRVRAGVLMSVALFLPVGFYDATLDRFLTDMGATNTVVALTFLAYGVPFALLATTGGRLADRHGPLRVAFLSTALVGPLTALYGVIGVPLLVAVVSAIEGCVQAVGVPGSQAVVAAGAPRGRAAAAQGLAGAANLLVGAVTGYLAGPLYSAIGPSWMYPLAGLGVVGFGVLALTQRERQHTDTTLVS